jgi:FkbM family methyltransferase
MDIGANNGDVAKSALMSFPGCKVICFEPVSESFRKLQDNLCGFKGRVYKYKCAFSDYSGETEINLTNYPPANSLQEQSKTYSYYNPTVKGVGTEKVKVYTLDSYLSRNCPKIDILKIDVEGSELNVINGGKQFLKERVDMIIIEISFARDNNYLQIFNTLESLGFKLTNIFDVDNLTYETDTIGDLMVIQMDCVFRKQK